jgi:OmpA-OmpF porin, OOP family
VVPISTGAEITLGADVLFAFGSAELGVPAREQLTGAIERIRSDRPRLVRVEGHTDAIGDAASNQTLSERRAAAVRAALAEQMSDVPVEAVGFGEDRPVAPNELPDGTDNPGGRQQNRRVAIVLVTS